MNIYQAMRIAYDHRESAPTSDDLEHDGDVAQLSKILADDPAQIHLLSEGEDGPQSPLHWAAECHLPRIAELLIRAGADVNQRSELRGRTPLLCALWQDIDSATPRLIRICEVLQRAGADPTLADKGGRTARQIAGQFVVFGHPIFATLAGEHGRRKSMNKNRR